MFLFFQHTLKIKTKQNTGPPVAYAGFKHLTRLPYPPDLHFPIDRTAGKSYHTQLKGVFVVVVVV